MATKKTTRAVKKVLKGRAKDAKKATRYAKKMSKSSPVKRTKVKSASSIKAKGLKKAKPTAKKVTKKTVAAGKKFVAPKGRKARTLAREAIKGAGQGVARKVTVNTAKKAGLTRGTQNIKDTRTGQRRVTGYGPGAGKYKKSNKAILKAAFDERANKRGYRGSATSDLKKRVSQAAKSAPKRGGLTYKNGKLTRVSSQRANELSTKRKQQRAEAAGRSGGRKFREIGSLKQTGSWRDRWGGGHFQGDGPRKPSSRSAAQASSAGKARAARAKAGQAKKAAAKKKLASMKKKKK